MPPPHPHPTPREFPVAIDFNVDSCKYSSVVGWKPSGFMEEEEPKDE